jgi:serine/threonine protein kinase
MAEFGDRTFGDRTYSGVTLERSPSERKQPSDTALAAPASLIGLVVGGRYRVTSLIGSGGMGAVYRAEHTALKKTVALKVLNQEMASHREAALRFEREAMVSAQIQHPNVVSATDSGRLPDGSLYLVLEYVEGHSLRELIDNEGRLPPARALHIGAQIAEALSAAHRAHVVHRDLKPGNVMLQTAEGHPEVVKVLDFGLARIGGAKDNPGEPLTRHGSVFGTPEYMSPEQARGEVVDHRADLYALGVILFELLSGRQPFIAPELVAVLIKHIQEPPPPLPAEIPTPIAQYVMALLDKEPSRRPADARQVAKALRRLSPASPLFSTAPPRLASSELANEDDGVPRSGAAPRPSGHLPGHLSALGSALKRIEWRELLRAPGQLLARASAARQQEPESSSTRGPAPRTSFGMWLVRPLGVLRTHRRVGIVAFTGLTTTILLGLAWGMWPREVPEELRERARQGQPEALGELAAVPAPERGPNASVALAIGYFNGAQFKQGIEALEDALDVDQNAGDSTDILRGVRRAVEAPETRVRALELAAKRLGSAGADLLFDVWISTNAKTPATRAAREWLDSASVRQHASPALQLALQIREAKGCAALQELLPKLTQSGDERSLKSLRRLQTNTGCGFLDLEDCYPCLRKGSALDDAVTAVSGRKAPEF